MIALLEEGAFEGSVLTLERDGERVLSVRLQEAGAFETGVTDVRASYAHDADGLRVAETITSGDRTVIIRHEYEDGRCVSRPSADPSQVLEAEILAPFIDPGPALGCGYWLDDDFY